MRIDADGLRDAILNDLDYDNDTINHFLALFDDHVIPEEDTSDEKPMTGSEAVARLFY